MDWVAFFEATRVAARVKNFAELAPLLGISDGAISHYRTGKRLPTAWIIADCLRIQGHSSPEKEAAKILKVAAHTSEERAFWRRLSATAAALMLCAMPFSAPTSTINHLASAASEQCILCYQARHHPDFARFTQPPRT
ncbi:DUF3693 domain-containing protein [Lysobacter firmicutimachus]|uniref:DUF3693 domain-containing protein n=1 Tax=Lysobacter firmicutimachus TaxID=1792846 RepID=A0ABU8D4M8_9GAMM